MNQFTKEYSLLLFAILKNLSITIYIENEQTAYIKGRKLKQYKAYTRHFRIL